MLSTDFGFSLYRKSSWKLSLRGGWVMGAEIHMSLHHDYGKSYYASVIQKSLTGRVNITIVVFHLNVVPSNEFSVGFFLLKELVSILQKGLKN